MCLGILLTHVIVETTKALGGSFKLLVTLAPKNCKGDDSTVQGNIKEWGYTNISKSTNEHTKHKPRINAQKTFRTTGLYELVPVSVQPDVHYGKLLMYSVNARDHFNWSPLLSHDQHHETECGQTERGSRD